MGGGRCGTAGGVGDGSGDVDGNETDPPGDGLFGNCDPGPPWHPASSNQTAIVTFFMRCPWGRRRGYPA